MGCDIHFFTEELNTETWQWTCDQAPTFEAQKEAGGHTWYSMESPLQLLRDYRLFGTLSAGVRDYVFDFSFAQRGMPDVLSDEIQSVYEYWSDCAHSASYLTLEELLMRHAEMLINPDPHALTLRPLLGEIIKAFPKSDTNGRHRRCVFWFDN